MKKIIIAAIDQENGIGKNNNLPWRIPEDMKFFKETTNGHVVVMGRKNWESIPLRFRPLPNRDNVIITRTLNDIEGATMVFNSLYDCFQYYDDKDVFIIGGGEIYNQTISMADEMYITHVDGAHDADVFFPKIDESIWEGTEIQKGEGFTIKHYIKK